MDDWCEAVERGKVRGYEEYKLLLGERYIYQYAMKKVGNIYLTYCFHIPESKIQVMEDYDTEEIQEFEQIEQAISHLESRGAVVNQFTAIKGVLPF
ncbi:hypothetical protein [Paenibacillus massiliensis]|uniref:hypothetical protein n=1 Tax=Paenibacillus massiliensis TaxID=225917 RepID=UPI000403ECF9|nr:hypothetical protein [Paenibacillus massiliensis]